MQRRPSKRQRAERVTQIDDQISQLRRKLRDIEMELANDGEDKDDLAEQRQNLDLEILVLEQERDELTS